MKNPYNYLTQPKEYATFNSLKLRIKKKWAFTIEPMTKDQQERFLTRELERELYKEWTYRFGTRRTAFLKYKAALSLRARELRAERDYDAARRLELHIKSLLDLAPREIDFNRGEWKLISRALRPRGSNPQPGREQEVYSIYQHMLRNRREV